MKSRILVIILLINVLLPTSILAKEGQTPILDGYQDGLYPKLEWAVEMLDEDVLYETGFEENDELPKLTYNSSGNRKYGGQSFTTEEFFNGKRSMKIVDSYTNGNYMNRDLNGNISYQDYSRANFVDRRYLANGTDLSISFRAKTTGEGRISYSGTGGAADFGTPIANTFLEDVKKGDRTAKVSNPQFFKSYVDRGRQYYIAGQKGRYSYLTVIGVDVGTSTITLNKPFPGEFSKGDHVLKHNHRNPVSFGSRSIDYKTGWGLYNLNTKVKNYADYNTLLRGFYLSFHTYTHDTIYIDDLKMGYATNTQLFRENKKVYEGYLSDFLDKGAIDKNKPNDVKQLDFKMKKGKLMANVVKPKDNGTTYTYRVDAVTNNGIHYPSKETPVTVISGIKGYSYIIDKNPATIPNTVVNTTSEAFEVPINTGDKYYVHVRAIDKEGNASNTTHYSFQDNKKPTVTITVDTKEYADKVAINIKAEDKETAIKRIQTPNGEWISSDKIIYTVNKNGEYTFKVEDIAGNLTKKTVKIENIIPKEFTMKTSDFESFGDIKIKDRPVKYGASFKQDITITNHWVASNGWRLDVSATPFTVVKPRNGYKGQEKEMPTGSLTLKSPKKVIQQTEGIEQLPNISIETGAVIDDGKVTVLEAGKENNFGEFKVEFPTNALEVTIDPTTALIDGVNYPNQSTPYESTITWDLVAAP